MYNDINDTLYNLKHYNALVDEEDTFSLHYITNLQQENERLKEENQNLLEEIHKATISSYEQGKQDYKEYNEDYKSRCEKASAELKDWEKLDLDNLLVAIRKTQNILQNEGNKGEK